jgi:hypothetical protein
LGVNFVRVDQSNSFLSIVLRALHRPQQSLFPSRKKQDQPLFRPSKCRSEFGTILHGKAPGCAGADIDQSAVTLETRMHCYHCGGNLFSSGLNRRDGDKLAFNDCFGNILSLPSVNARITGAGMLWCS